KATDILIQNVLENIDESQPDWTYVASRLYLQKLYWKAAHHRGYDEQDKYGDFYELIHLLTDKGIYAPVLLAKYSEEDIRYFADQINTETHLPFDNQRLHTIAARYLAVQHE